MRPGLTGIRNTAGQRRALRRAVPAGKGAVLAIALAAMSLTLAACDSGSTAAGGTATGPAAASSVKVTAHEAGQTRAQVYESVRQMTAVGKQLFFDASLSGSGKLACASCHSPDHGFSPANSLSVQLGGNDMHRTGMRAAPTLKYLQSVPAFAEHYHESTTKATKVWMPGRPAV
jgi:Cytochrome c peroxidase